MYGRGRSAEQRGRRDERPYFVILSSEPSRNRSRRTEQLRYSVKFRRVEEAERPDRLLESVLEALFQRCMQGRPQPKLLGISLQPPDFQQPFNVPLRPPLQNSAAAIATAIQDLQRRYPNLEMFSGATEIKVNIVWELAVSDPSGGCSLLPEEEEEERTAAEHRQLAPIRLQSFWRVQNPDDRWCLCRSLYLGLIFHRLLPVPIEFLHGPGAVSGPRMAAAAVHVPKRFLEEQNQHTGKIREMMLAAGLCLNKPFYGRDDASLLQQWLNALFGNHRVRLIIISREDQYRVTFRGADQPAEINLCIYIEKGHYSFLGRPEQLFNVNF
jgi:hypothetical protein